MKSKRVISSVTSDLYTDQRVHRIAQHLFDHRWEVQLIGRKRHNSPELDLRSYETYRMKLWFEKGFLFYANYNLMLFLKLLFVKADLFLANDLDVLPANVLAGKIRGIPVYLDAHEYFTEVPELVSRPMVQKIWKLIERMCMPSVRRGFSVSSPIAKNYTQLFSMGMDVIRNLPLKIDLNSIKAEEGFKFPKDEFRILLYQGSVNVHRGLEEMISAMPLLPLCKLYIIGEGDVLEQLKIQVEKAELESRVIFIGRVNFKELASYTVQADLGISLEKPVGLSYTYALPNKFFDYIQVGLPSLISKLPEMLKINDEFDVAEVITDHSPESISKTILQLFADEERYKNLKANCLKAKESLCWEEESKKLEFIFHN